MAEFLLAIHGGTMNLNLFAVVLKRSIWPEPFCVPLWELFLTNVDRGLRRYTLRKSNLYTVWTFDKRVLLNANPDCEVTLLTRFSSRNFEVRNIEKRSLSIELVRKKFLAPFVPSSGWSSTWSAIWRNMTFKMILKTRLSHDSATWPIANSLHEFARRIAGVLPFIRGERLMIH